MNFLKKYWITIKDICQKHLNEGISTHKISFTVTLGSVLGIIPLPGTTIVLCILTAFIFKLNHVLIQAVNVIVYPLQLLLIIPFYQMGNVLFLGKKIGANSFNFSGFSFANTIQLLGKSTVSALLLWFFICVPVGLLIYFLLKRVLSVSFH